MLTIILTIKNLKKIRHGPYSGVHILVECVLEVKIDMRSYCLR